MNMEKEIYSARYLDNGVSAKLVPYCVSIYNLEIDSEIIDKAIDSRRTVEG